MKFYLILSLLAYAWAFPSFHKNVQKINGRIINGETAAVGQFPWQAAIRASYQDGTGFCGGSLISDEWVLTAGHCVDGAWIFDVVLGSTKPTPYDNPNATIIQASRFILHEGYENDPEYLILTNDIALIRLDKKVEFGDNVGVIALGEDELGVDAVVTISGWGTTSDDGIYVSTILRYTTVRTILEQECQYYYGDIIDDDKFCSVPVGNLVQGPCAGDSGGPVVINVDTNPVHVGVVSFTTGRGCETNLPAGYTRTSYFREWIKNNSGI